MFRRKAVLLGITAIVIGMLFGLRLQAQCKNADDYLYIFTVARMRYPAQLRTADQMVFCRTTRIAPVADSSVSTFYDKDRPSNEISLAQRLPGRLWVRVYDLRTSITLPAPSTVAVLRPCRCAHRCRESATGSGHLGEQ